eukprot:12298021-Alexandrium_andersonii.AAC.1
MSCNVTALGPRVGQLMETLNDGRNPTTCIMAQEHATPQRAAASLCKLAASKKLTAHLGPVDPDASRDSAGVGAFATRATQLAEVAPATEGGAEPGCW